MKIPEKEVKAVAKMRQWTVERFRALREAKGYTQTQLADKMGVHYTRISDFEANRSDYKASTLFRISRYLGITMEQAFRGAPMWKKGKSDEDPVLVITTENALSKALRDAGVARPAIRKAINALTDDLVN